MHGRKRVRPRMDSLGTLALTGRSFEDFKSETIKSRLLQRNKKNLTKNFIRRKFAKEASISNPVKTLFQELEQKQTCYKSL